MNEIFNFFLFSLIFFEFLHGACHQTLFILCSYICSTTNATPKTHTLTHTNTIISSTDRSLSLEEEMSPDSLRSLSQDFLTLLINAQDLFSDVTFSVEGRLVHAHRCILAARSLFFRKLLCGPEARPGLIIAVNTVRYEVFLLMLQFLYSGQIVPVVPLHKCWEMIGCDHAHCTSAVDLALDTLAAARSLGVEQLAFITQVFRHL